VPAPDPGASRSLRARLRGGPLARAIGRMDLRLYRLLRRDLHHAAAEPHVRRFSTAGEHAALWYAIGGVALVVDTGRRPQWRRAMLAVLVTQLVNTAAKAVVRRRRPAFEDLPALVKVPTSLSFPSAHSSTSFAAARGFGALVPTARGPLYVLASLMALSRVYLGVHYPSDIAVGAILGSVIQNAGRP
jgi:membrane-associated phospholipid phosphatase